MADGAKLNAAPHTAGGDDLPSSNRGVSESGKPTWAGLDWVAGSVDLLQVLQQQGWDTEGTAGEGIAAHLAAFGPKPKPKTPEADDQGELIVGRRHEFVKPDQVTQGIARDVFAYLLGDSGLLLAADAGPGKFYAYRYMVTNFAGEPAGMLEIGGSMTLRKVGMRPTARLELTGLGCAILEGRGDASADHAKPWCALRAKLECVGGDLSRVDVAFDCFNGERSIALARTMYEYGSFDYKFGGEMIRPKFKAFSASHGQGDTFYVGHSSSEKQLRVYEKGKQLGDPESPWVRWELQFRSSTRRKLTLNMLTDPLSYAAGAYAALDFFSRNVARLVVTKEATKATVKSVMRHAKRMFGSSLHRFRIIAPDRESFDSFMDFISVEKPPKWAKTGRLDWQDVQALIAMPDNEEKQQ